MKVGGGGRGREGRKRFLPFFLTPSQLFYWRDFSCGSPVLHSRSSFFAPKPHGNACYAGYVNPGKFMQLALSDSEDFLKKPKE